uniref:Splicing factor U2af large subunit n=1 Tax=Wollemia nobilis TaxID=56998 RepID=A0A0C9QXC6_9CONI
MARDEGRSRSRSHRTGHEDEFNVGRDENSLYEDDRGRERMREDAGKHRDRGHRDDRARGGGRSYRNHRYREENDRIHRNDRDRRHDHEREYRSRRRSRSGSPERSHDRRERRSRSGSRERKSKRTSGFDLGPAGASVAPAVSLAGLMPGIGQAMTGVFPSMLPFAGGTQATRHARRVYVGGLPPTANEQSVAAYFSQVMAAVGGNTAGPGDAVVNVYINQEKRFAFVEMRTAEEASNAMALDGIVYEGVPVRVKRPSDYNPLLAAALGPSQPNPNLNLAAVGLVAGSTGIADGPDRIFVGGLPYYLTEDQIIDLLSSFAPLGAFDLVKDRETGNSKGYGFCVYQDPAVIDIACAALNGLKMGDRTLTVRRASASGQPKPEQADVLVHAQQQIAVQKLALQLNGSTSMSGMISGLFTEVESNQLANVATKVVCLSQVVEPDDLRDDNEYEEILEDMRDECGKYGTLINLVIPRPGPSEIEASSGVGMVFVEYSDAQAAARAIAALNGRKFGGNVVSATFYSEEKFEQGDYGG